MNVDDRALADGLAELGIRPTDEQLAHTAAWLGAVSTWNKVYNLTAVRDAKEQLEKLVFDSLAALPFLRAGAVLDVGSGAGAPGLPLAIFAPKNAYTLIDAVMKKVYFLERCIDDLGLAHVRAVHKRLEQLKATTAYDTIVSRGVGGADRLLRAGAHLAKQSTRWIVFRPAKAAPETLGDAWRVEHVPAPGRRKTLSLMIVERAT